MVCCVVRWWVDGVLCGAVVVDGVLCGVVVG